MDPSPFSPLAWLVAGQFALSAAGWGLFSLLLRVERAAVAHWGGFMLLMGLGFLLSAQRGAERDWWPYVGSNLCFLLGYAALRRGLLLFMRVPTGDRELLLTVLGFGAGLVWAGAGVEQASWRVLLTYGAGVWMLTRAVADVAPAARAEFGLGPLLVAASPALALIVGFGLRIARQLLDWSQPLEMQLAGQLNTGLLFAYLTGAALFNFSFMAMVTVRLTARLRQQARHDPLTGLPNRRALEADLQAEWQRLQQGGTGFAVIALDLDHFKRVNDEHGHLAGDQVLEQFGARLRELLRDGDRVARTGGEEFIVLVPATQQGGALAMAERLRQGVLERPFGGPSQPLPLTVSVGVALADAGTTDLRQLMQRADEALYRAKAEGRNRVVMHQASAAVPAPRAPTVPAG